MHDAHWEDYFLIESKRIQQALYNETLPLEHIGSTSVKGLVAKPIIDIAGTLASFDNIQAIAKAMEDLGYTYKGENGIEDRHFFTKGKPTTFHVHLTLEGHPIFENHIRFRDALRQNPAAIQTYNRLKQDLLKRFPNDRKAYTEGKHDFIQSILRGGFDA